tara:strand:- start:2592 stop:3008 length:417 start_codon:yes stop_codon:yes gene_type:complete
MPKFTTKDGGILEFGNNETYNKDDEIAFIFSLEKQINSMNPQNPNDVKVFKTNVNEVAKLIGVDQLPVNEMWDEVTRNTYQYFADNMNLFKKHGITEHINAKKIERVTSPAFTETEHAPTIEEMKALEVDIGKLYDQA